MVRVVGEFVGFSLMSCDDNGDIGWSIVWLARVNVKVSAVVRCLLERKTWGGLSHTLNAKKQGNSLWLAMRQLIWKVQHLLCREYERYAKLLTDR